jgi:hypothetical protein
VLQAVGGVHGGHTSLTPEERGGGGGEGMTHKPVAMEGKCDWYAHWCRCNHLHPLYCTVLISVPALLLLCPAAPPCIAELYCACRPQY